MSLDQSSVCIVNASGTIVRETEVLSEPEALGAVGVAKRPASAALWAAFISRPGRRNRATASPSQKSR